ncbi:restriction system protein [Modicisalibacter ilicicola DSM 19980]|uniref:Restriction system protein n=1 Tax=Modicisalibacter ilicicola DSM 19980 TaxID=1121942 RepID=A0A1M4W2Z8_9GAMM|nr:restriction endonuclease [Halomonas ilicicola]SHE75493.1 restriction system protein [Halomonas ilicicola DSM 19980]
MQKVRTPLFPTYAQAAAFMKASTGLPPKAVRDMITAIHDQTGTPQNPVDWSDPDTWIAERLEGAHAELALKIWQTDKQVMNPRHSYGSWMFINNYGLMEIDGEGCWQPSERGQQFLGEDEATLKWLDDEEGLLALLELLSGLEMAKRSDILPEWMAFLHQVSKFASESSCKTTLHQRLSNLVARGLVERQGNRYQISSGGLGWLKDSLPKKADDPRKAIINGVNRYNLQQKQLLKDHLAAMDPYQFEALIGELLRAMGYEDVEVTKASGDKGVDVVGSVQVGITTITEVVQVKRQQGSITRPVVDQLRGALPYHKAIRGTLITLGKFASSCEQAALFPGAAPITLIDGDRLIDLLVENQVGVRKSRPVELLELDTSAFEISEALVEAE